MKKLMVLVIVMVVLGAAGVGYAAEDKLGIDVDVTWVSKYIWRGFDKLDDKAAFQPSINLDLGSGFSANVWTSQAGSSGSSGLSTVDAEEWNYTLAYASTVL